MLLHFISISVEHCICTYDMFDNYFYGMNAILVNLQKTAKGYNKQLYNNHVLIDWNSCTLLRILGILRNH